MCVRASVLNRRRERETGEDEAMAVGDAPMAATSPDWRDGGDSPMGKGCVRACFCTEMEGERETDREDEEKRRRTAAAAALSPRKREKLYVCVLCV